MNEIQHAFKAENKEYRFDFDSLNRIYIHGTSQGCLFINMVDCKLIFLETFNPSDVRNG